MTSEDIFDQLTDQLGGFIKEVTGRTILLGKEGAWNRPVDEFILVDLQSAEPLLWAEDYGLDIDGNTVYTQNFVVTFLVTAFKGKTHSVLTKVVQKFNHRFTYYKYFPACSPFAYSSCSSVSRTRVPVEDQEFENQSSVILNFNVCFIESDDDFETLDEINVTGIVKKEVDDPSPLEFKAAIKIPVQGSSSE